MSQLTDRERIEKMLNEETVGHLGLADDNQPYIVPLNYTYHDGRILAHCALEGRKLDIIRKNPKACFEISRMDGDPTPHGPDACDVAFSSVMCWGTARVLDDPAERLEVLNQFLVRYSTELHPRSPITLQQAERCSAIMLAVERMTGRFWAGKESDVRCEWTR